jgi:REP element-mobilizing transposase RayT
MLEKQLKLARSKLEDSLFNNRARERIEQFQRQWFAKFEAILHQNAFGPTWLKDKRIASLVSKGLHELDGDEYRLDCYCIMSNHVHTVFQLFVAESNLREVLNMKRRPEFLSSYPGL